MVEDDLVSHAYSILPRKDWRFEQILKPSRRSFGRGVLKKFLRYRRFFPVEIFFCHISCCLFAKYAPAVEYMFSFVQLSHPLCAVFQYFAVYLAPTLSVFVSVLLYWVRPLVILFTFAASAFMLGYI
jgi:hypothetical protein